MRGFATDIQLFRFHDGVSYRPSVEPQSREEYKCVAVLCSKDYPKLSQVIDAIKRGAEKYPEAVWVCRAKDPSAISAFESARVEPLLLDLNPFWKSDVRDHRREIRDADIRCYCSHVLVFTTKESKALDNWRPKHKGEMSFLNSPNVFVVEPEKRRRGSVGAYRSDAG